MCRLEERRGWDHDAIEAWQVDALRAILHQAWKAPYYSQAFSTSGVDSPEAITSLAHLVELPLLSREVLQREAERLLAGGQAQVVWHRSSGTTGAPVRFALPASLRWGVNAAHLYHYYGWHGFQRSDRRVTLGGRYVGVDSRGIVLRNPFERQLLLSAHSLNERSAGRYVRAIARFHPRALQGHPSGIVFLVRLAEAQGIALPQIPLVFTTGEVLTEEARRLCDEAFGARTVGQYGHGEMAAAAYECEARAGYHVDPFWGIVDLVPAAGGLFEIVATSLLNTSMPFIRYRTGDLTSGWVDGLCACGRPWRRLRDVIGRTDDVVLDVSGRPVAPVTLRTALAHRFADLPMWSLVGTPEQGRYELELFPSGPLRARVVQDVVEELRRHLGREAVVDVSVRSLAEVEARGKWRTVRAAVPGRVQS